MARADLLDLAQRRYRTVDKCNGSSETPNETLFADQFTRGLRKIIGTVRFDRHDTRDEVLTILERTVATHAHSAVNEKVLVNWL